MTTSWIYRGEPSDAATEKFFPLVPSALRPTMRRQLCKLGLVFAWKEDENREFPQICSEFVVLQRFFECADNCGLPIPEDAQTIRKYLQHESRLQEALNKLTNYGGTWIPEQLLSLAGLAQHYGLPTRLLDWSRNHLVAAYFAARSVLSTTDQPEHSGKSLVGWALRDSALYKWQYHAHRIPTQHPLQISTAPAAMNPNLHAQRGLFTSWAVTDTDDEIDRRPLNQRLADEKDFQEVLKDKPAFVRVRLPHSRARSLLQHLIRLGVTAGRLFPGFKGAADAVRDWELAFGDNGED